MAHVEASAVQSSDPDLWLGAALPDLLPMARLDRSALPPAVIEGLAHHHRADAVFHDDPRFRAPVSMVRARLEELGVARGPRRAAAHVGVELLLDGALLDQPDGGAAFGPVWSRLRDPDELVRGLASPEERRTWVGGLERLTTRLDPWTHTDPRSIAHRLEHVLGRRPRLALAPGDAELVADALCRVADEVAGSTPGLLADVAASARRA